MGVSITSKSKSYYILYITAARSSPGFIQSPHNTQPLSHKNVKHNIPGEFYLNSEEMFEYLTTKVTSINDLPYWAYICGSISHLGSRDVVWDRMVFLYYDIRRLGIASKSSRFSYNTFY